MFVVATEWPGARPEARVSQAQNKSEKPTERKRREARREGKTPRSQEVGTALSLFALVVALRLIVPTTVPAIRIASRSSATSRQIQPSLLAMMMSTAPMAPTSTGKSLKKPS